jgi:hypothetical protein
MAKIILILVAMSFFPSQLLAGDYMLVVADEANTTECSKQMHWPVFSSAAVAISLEQFFSGANPDIGILKAAFVNGHLQICGSKERDVLLQSLRKIKSIGAKANNEHVGVFISRLELLN